MKNVIVAGIAVTAVLVAAGPTWAFPGMGGPGKAAHPTTGPASTQPTNPLKARYDRVLTELKLPAAKAEKVKKILDDNYKSLMAWVVKVDPEVVKLRQQMAAVHLARDPETVKKVQAAMARYRELQEEMKAKVAEAFEPLSKELTDKQLATAKAILLPQPKAAPRPMGTQSSNPFHLLPKLGLSNEQITRISKIMDEERAAAEKAKTPGETNYQAKAWPRIVKEVLTDAQRAKLRDVMAAAAHQRMVQVLFSGLNLTPEQQEKANKIWMDAYEAGKKDPKNRMAIYSKAKDKIISDVLTDAQRKQIKSGGGHGMPHGMGAGK